MGFLPYGGGGAGAWTGSFVFSVSAHVVLAVGLVQIYNTEPIAPPEEERVAFTVTLEELDTGILTGTVQDEETETLDPDDPDSLAPEEVETAALSGTEPESLEPETVEPESVEPEDPVEPEDAIEPVEPEDTTEPETPEELAVEQPEALEPETAEAVEPEPETPEIPPELQSAQPVDVPDAIGTLEGVVPDGSIAVAVDPASSALASTVVEPVTPIAPVADASPISPIAETSPIAPDLASPVVGDGAASVAAVQTATSAIAPIASDGPTAVVALAPSAGGLAPITTVDPEPETVASVTTPPEAPQSQSQPTPVVAPSAPSAQDRALRDLIQRIRTTDADRCLIALPRRDGEDGVGLALISASETAMESFAQSLLGPDDADIRQTRTLVDQRQCAALSYIRASGDYPATRMGISADITELASGDSFTGVLRGAAGRYLTLLVIDDNGVVQDLQRFLSFSANLARFDVPVNRSGPARDTKQVLLAIATTRPPELIRERIGRLAEDVFAGLPPELSADAALAVLTFDVR